MSISSTEYIKRYVGDGALKIFSFPYYASAAGDIKVDIDDVVQSSGYTNTQTVFGDNSAWTVTFVTEPALNEKISIYRDTTNTQDSDYVTNDPIPDDVIENDFDKRTAVSQEIDGEQARAIKLPRSDTPDAANSVLPNAATRASKLFGWDASGDLDMVTVTSGSPTNAAAITYSPGGTGAVDTTVQADLRTRRNAKFYGATVDGSTDDTVGIQRANAAAGGGDLYFPAGTYILDGITAATGRWILAEDAILKHKDNAASDMISASGNFTIVGGELDGNKDNQTGRYSILSFTGDDLTVTGSRIKNSVKSAIEVEDALTVSITRNRFTDIGEHGGTLGETANTVFIDESVSIARCHINDNFFVNPAPSGTNLAPTAIQFSTELDKAVDCVISGNIISGFGTQFTDNQTACIEIYKGVNGVKITDNSISNYYWTAIRVTDSSAPIVSNNTIRDCANATIEANSYALGIVAYNHADVAAGEYDVICTGNIIDNEYTTGMYISGTPTNATTYLHRVIVSDNIITRAGEKGFWHSWTDGEVISSNNVIHDHGEEAIYVQKSTGSFDLIGNVISSIDGANTNGNGIVIEDATGDINITGGRISTTGTGGSGILARTTITSLDLSIHGVTLDSCDNYGITVRDANSLKVSDCIYTGSDPASDIFDMDTIGTGYVQGCSWQKVQYPDTTTSLQLNVDDYGKTFTNEGNASTCTFLLPSVADCVEGFWVRFLVLAAQQVYLDPNILDQIFPTCNAVGDRLGNTGVIGASVTLEYTHADGWTEQNKIGTWTDDN